MSDPVSDLKQELLAAAERQHGNAALHPGRRRLRGDRGRNRLLLTAATLSIAAAVALLVTAPWQNSPGFLERAHAALTTPAGTILHRKWVSTVTLTDPACTVNRGPSESWIDQTPPHRYRMLLRNELPGGPDDPRHPDCSSGTASELGGTLDTTQILMFKPPNTLSIAPFQRTFPPDPVTHLREAIRAGSAHHEGETQLHGRTVERIRIDPDPDCPVADCQEPGYVYVDPETFYPVEARIPGFIVGDGPVVRLTEWSRNLTFEYLPRTAANLALTDIRAQHPNSVGP